MQDATVAPTAGTDDGRGLVGPLGWGELAPFLQHRQVWNIPGGRRGRDAKDPDRRKEASRLREAQQQAANTLATVGIDLATVSYEMV